MAIMYNVGGIQGFVYTLLLSLSTPPFFLCVCAYTLLIYLRIGLEL